MIHHVLLTKFQDPEDCLDTVIEKLHSMEGAVPGIRSMTTGRDFLHSGRSYDLCLHVTFDTREALEAYDKHPFHQEVRKYIHAHRTASAVVDYED